jgi:hypothetical protein
MFWGGDRKKERQKERKKDRKKKRNITGKPSRR